MSRSRIFLVNASLFRSLSFFIKDSVNSVEGTPNVSGSEVNIRLETDEAFAVEHAKKAVEGLQRFIVEMEKPVEEPAPTETEKPVEGSAEPAKTEQEPAPTEPAEPVKTE